MTMHTMHTKLAMALLIMVPTPGVAQEGEAAANAPQPKATRVDRTLPWVTDEVQAPRLTFHTFASETVGAAVSFHVYVPSTYDDEDVRLPVLYWLHGTAGGTNGVRPLTQHLDAAMREGSVPPMLVVFVNGLPARLWCDAKDGSSPVETVFVTELIPHVDKTFRTIANRQGRILEGFSMGGYGAARLGFRHPDVFAGISMLAGGPLDLDFAGPRAAENPRQRDRILREVCGDDLEYFRRQSPWRLAVVAAEALRTQHTIVRQVVGDRDFSLALNRQFHEHLSQLEIPHDFIELPGVAHDPRAVLNALAATSGEFYWRALGRGPGEVGRE